MFQCDLGCMSSVAKPDKSLHAAYQNHQDSMLSKGAWRQSTNLGWPSVKLVIYFSIDSWYKFGIKM